MQLTDSAGEITQEYDYDAFGVEKDADIADANPFRYCGEYFDAETGAYYLRARYYTPTLGRFMSEDTHWNPKNMVYGDNYARVNATADALGIAHYTYTPDVYAIRQSMNLYRYCGNDPLTFLDPTGNAWYHWVLGGVLVAAAAAAVVVTAGGALPAVYAVSAVASGAAAATAASTVAAGAFIGSAAVYSTMALTSAINSRSIGEFNAQGNWDVVAFTAAGLLVGNALGYTLYINNEIQIAGRGHTGRTEASNLNEQLAMKQVLSDPLNGATQLKSFQMADSRWLASDGWVKMANNIKLADGTNIEIHFVYNTVTNVFDDFKFALNRSK